eukprot:8103415-Lingulodinium_polyedra.AAC.1
MLKLSRTRQHDPINATDDLARQWGRRDKPSLENDANLAIPLARLTYMLPEYDDRRAILARDPL